MATADTQAERLRRDLAAAQATLATSQEAAKRWRSRADAAEEQLRQVRVAAGKVVLSDGAREDVAELEAVLTAQRYRFRPLPFTT